MRTGLCTDRRFRAHAAPGSHPECPERLAAIERVLDESGLGRRCLPVAAREATRAELEGVHASAYLDRLAATLAAPASGEAEARGWLDADTYFSPGSWTAALLAAGAAVDLGRAVLDGTLDNAAGFVRPPGHHATRDHAMGFCLLNNVAVAAAALRADGARVAIVDFDVHHGNGTEAIFYEDPDVLYISLHQWPLYPGTGALEDRGAGTGLGTTLNVPLPEGSGDAGYLHATEQVTVPALARFRPDVLLLSAGFDAHRKDPLSSMNVTEVGYARMTERLAAAVGGRIAALLEGGYDLDALGASAATVVSVLLGDAPPWSAGGVHFGDAIGAPSATETAAVERARRIHFPSAT